jgi:hypothetical protein
MGTLLLLLGSHRCPFDPPGDLAEKHRLMFSQLRDSAGFSPAFPGGLNNIIYCECSLANDCFDQLIN